MKRFAKTIVKVLLAYADIVKKEFPAHMKDERIVSLYNILFSKYNNSFCHLWLRNSHVLC